MLHPIFRTVLGRPELIANHLAGYAALVKEEASETTRGWVARAVAGAVALFSTMLALVLIGVAVMLGVLHGQFNWVLVIVPGVAVLLAVIAGTIAARPASASGFAELRAQFDADLRALHTVGKQDHAD